MELLTHLLSDEACPTLHLALGRIQEDPSCDVLTGKEQKEYSAFTSEKRRCEFVSTRYLVRKLSSHAGLDPKQMETQKDELGKPFGLYDGKHLYISIAHTGNKILCAMSTQTDIGVDIEPADRKVGKRLRARILHPGEESQLEDVESIRLWTIKEAAVKLSGSGLRTNLNDLAVQPLEKNGFLARFNDEKIARICSFQYQDYWISVAYFI